MLNKFLLFLDRNLGRLPFGSHRLERAVYDLLCHRRQQQKWEAAVKAHLANGGVVVTHKWSGGETQTLVGGAR